jgi:hypothetical protein
VLSCLALRPGSKFRQRTPLKILPGRLGPFSTYFVDPWGINMPSCTGAFVMLLHIGREPSLELAHQRAKARHDGDRLEQRP